MTSGRRLNSIRFKLKDFIYQGLQFFLAFLFGRGVDVFMDALAVRAARGAYGSSVRS